MEAHEQTQSALQRAFADGPLADLSRGEVRPLEDAEADVVHAVGVTLYEREDLRSACDVFRYLVLGRPTEARSWSALAMCHDALDDTDRAIALYEVAVCAPDLHGARPRAVLYLARALWHTARFDESRARLAEIDVDALDDDELRALYLELDEALAREGGRR